MPKHTEAEMEQLSLEDLKKFASEPEEAAPIVETKAEQVEEKEESEAESEPEMFVVRRELKSGEVFEAESTSELEALRALVDKLADGKEHATEKIKQQAEEIKEYKGKNPEKPKLNELSADDKYVIQQKLRNGEPEAIEEYVKTRTGYGLEDLAQVKKKMDVVEAKDRFEQNLNKFLATHQDYVNHGDAGAKNEQAMYMALSQIAGFPINYREDLFRAATPENLSKAYSTLKESGFLELKVAEGAHADAGEETKETERIVQPKVEAAQTRTKKTSGISTHSRTTTAPLNTEPSEDELYKMPMDKLRELANKQLAAR